MTRQPQSRERSLKKVRRYSVILLAGFVLSTLLVVASSAAAAAVKGTDTPNAVVALVDTGINPYHVTFRDRSPRARKHPSTYLPDYPRNAIGLRLTLDEPDYWEAVRADCKRVWSKVEPGKLYWFPGTKIVGAISFSNTQPVNCEQPQPTGGAIRDQNGHGTMVASRAASTEYGACKECLIVAVQGLSVESIEWAADNARWIDAQSNSWGPSLPLPTDPAFVRAVEETASRHLSFWATGNGVATRGGILGHPTILDPRMTPSIVMVGGHDSGYINLWPGLPPHVVSDSCASWAARHFDVSESGSSVGSGTSAAAPFAAGGAARILLEARRMLGEARTGVRDGVVATGRRGRVQNGPLDDGKLTLEEWKELTIRTGTPRPQAQEEDGPPCPAGLYGPTPLQWSDVPEGYPEYLHIGYGAIDSESWALARRVLRGNEAMPARTETDEYFARDRQIRETTHSIFRGP